MSGLQAEESTFDQEVEVEEAGTEQPETVSESATDEGETPEKKIEFTEEQRQYFEDVVAKKAFKAREAEREAKRLRQELESIKANQAKETRPEVPPMPDTYDDDFEAKIAARDKAIRDAAAYDLRESQRVEDQKKAAASQSEAEAEKLQERINTYTQKATSLGVKPDELAKAGKVVADYGIHDEVAGFILDSDAGPLITRYLSRNLSELDKLQEMPPLKAAVYIENVLKHKAAGKKATSAPDPVEPLKGAGVPPTKRGPKGATFT